MSLKDLFDKHGSDKSRTHGYHAAYELLCGQWREQATAVLEIGVDQGASLRAWREYFPNALLVCVDSNPRCRTKVPDGSVFYCCDQADGEKVAAIAAEHKAFDLVVDDGSHRPAAQVAAFRTLWPHVKSGGVYAIEDVHVVAQSPRRANRERVTPPLDLAVGEFRKQLGQTGPESAAIFILYRNGIFIYKPEGYTEGCPL